MVPKSERFEMRVDGATLEQLDKWRSSQPGVPSRSEAARRLLEIGLAASDSEVVRFSPGEKYALLMLRDISRHLKVKGDLDPDLVAEAIFGGHYWALPWQHTGIHHGEVHDEEQARFVSSVMQMWTQIEQSVRALSKDEKARLAKVIPNFAEASKFKGFDGNTESEFSIARFLIKNMDRFQSFKDRDLNSHWPMVATYRRMLEVFGPMQEAASRTDGRLTGAQIEALLADSNLRL
ncbi:MAG: YfbU family protein [Planctomycetes bacterium]|nr:YfbU family protein [Planctomycetota bacterium]